MSSTNDTMILGGGGSVDSNDEISTYAIELDDGFEHITFNILDEQGNYIDDAVIDIIFDDSTTYNNVPHIQAGVYSINLGQYTAPRSCFADINKTGYIRKYMTCLTSATTADPYVVRLYPDTLEGECLRLEQAKSDLLDLCSSKFNYEIPQSINIDSYAAAMNDKAYTLPVKIPVVFSSVSTRTSSHANDLWIKSRPTLSCSGSTRVYTPYSMSSEANNNIVNVGFIVRKAYASFKTWILTPTVSVDTPTGEVYSVYLEVINYDGTTALYKGNGTVSHSSGIASGRPFVFSNVDISVAVAIGLSFQSEEE